MRMPPSPRAVTFVDGQNLFYAAKEAFGYTYPNYDPLKLATPERPPRWDFPPPVMLRPASSSPQEYSKTPHLKGWFGAGAGGLQS